MIDIKGNTIFPGNRLKSPVYCQEISGPSIKIITINRHSYGETATFIFLTDKLQRPLKMSQKSLLRNKWEVVK